MNSDAVTWVATLSNGTTVTEHTGDYQIVPGERKPWVKLCSFLSENDLHLTSLRINFKGRTIHLPRSNFTKFNSEGISINPEYYSLQYHVEIEDALGDSDATYFVDLAAHFKNYAVHYIQDITHGDNSWVNITENADRLAPTPRVK